uniref:Immunoglobulin V-set domain-containing protein n=1 Tax=Pygocentrus nattereri TaxID=42514 RepID=A0A3B4EDJ9_PYGNA
MITLITALFLFTTVKTGISGLQVQTVRRGNIEVIKSKGNKNGLVWYWQSTGKVPQYIVRTFEHDNKHRFAREFENGRFTMTVDEERFDLNIYGVSWTDIGMYFCGKGKSNVVEFGSGTLLVFEGNDKHTFSDDCTQQMHVLFCFSITRAVILIILVGVLTVLHRDTICRKLDLQRNI